MTTSRKNVDMQNTASRRSSKAAASGLLSVPDVSGMTAKEAAHAYLEAGFWPIPWKVAIGKGGKRLKRPCYPKGWTYATVARETHESIDRWPDSWQVGLITHPRSGILAADIDYPEEFGSWEIDDPPETASSDTGRAGGYHLVYDARKLALSEWPVQGDIPGGQVKSNGFIGVEPSVHPNGRTYRWDGLRSLSPVSDFGRTMAEYRRTHRRKRSPANGNAASAGQDELWQAVLDAKDTKQRGAIFAWSVSAHNRGLTDDEIIDRLELAVFRKDIESYRPGDEWNRAGLRDAAIPTDGWEHEVLTGAAAEEEDALLRDIRELRLIDGKGRLRTAPAVKPAAKTGLVESFADIKRKTTEWIILDYLARGEMTILDGEKASAKSFVWEDWAARLSRGDTVPWEKHTGEIFRTIVFTTESAAESEIGPRLDAAGADSSRVFRHVVRKVDIPPVYRNGPEHTKPHKYRKANLAVAEWVLPDHADQFAAAIREARADIAIFDPVNDFFSGKVNINSDADIRRALLPLGNALRKTGCAGLLIRHMNKNTGVQARYRGTGTTAYQNRGRVHLVASSLPEELSDKGEYGIAVIDNNLRKVRRGVRTYRVVDSSIPSDNSDGYVGKVEWLGIYNISADDMTKSGAHGIETYALEELVNLLRPMFDDKDTWPAKDILAVIEEAGLHPDGAQKRKAKKRLGIESRKRAEGWIWTTAHNKLRIKRSGG